MIYTLRLTSEDAAHVTGSLEFLTKFLPSAANELRLHTILSNIEAQMKEQNGGPDLPR